MPARLAVGPAAGVIRPRYAGLGETGCAKAARPTNRNASKAVNRMLAPNITTDSRSDSDPTAGEAPSGVRPCAFGKLEQLQWYYSGQIHLPERARVGPIGYAPTGHPLRQRRLI